jgi:glycosyltransferase involved in cell wall biosynthesis
MRPELSVLVVTCNRPAGLRRVLQDLASQSLAPERFEVLVSDDGSDVPAAEVAADFGDRLALEVIRGPSRGPATARNRALPALRAPLTLLLNDDVWLDPELLESHLALQRLYGRQPTAVMGSFEFPAVLREQPLHRIVEDLGMIGTLQMRAGLPLPPQWFWTGNLCLPTAELLAVNGFDEAFREPKGDFRGVSLVPELFGAEAKPRPVLADLPRCDLMDRRRAYIDGDYKLLSFGDEASFQMYDVNKDFLEEHDLSTTHPDKFARMKQDYLAFVEQIPNVNVVGPAVLKGAPPGRRW